MVPTSPHCALHKLWLLIQCQKALEQGGKIDCVRRDKSHWVLSHVVPAFPIHVVHIQQAQLGLVCTYCIRPTSRETSAHPRSGSSKNWASGPCECDQAVWQTMVSFHSLKPWAALHFNFRSFPKSHFSYPASVKVLPKVLLLSPSGLLLVDPDIIAIVQMWSPNSNLADLKLCSLSHYILYIFL